MRTFEKTSNKWMTEDKTAPYHSQHQAARVVEEGKEDCDSKIEIIVTKSRKKIGG